MSIRKRTWKNADGTESIRWIVDILDTNGHRERRQFDSRKEADAFRFATEKQMRAGTFRSDASKFTVRMLPIASLNIATDAASAASA